MASEIGFGVVGLGMGRHHCNAIDRAEGARLVAVCDARREASRRRHRGIRMPGLHRLRKFSGGPGGRGRQYRHPIRVARKAGDPGRESGQTSDCRKTGGHHRRADRRDYLRLRGERRQGSGDLSGPFKFPQYPHTRSCSFGPARQADRCPRTPAMVPRCGVLRRCPRFVEGHLEHGRRGFPDEPGRPTPSTCCSGSPERSRACSGGSASSPTTSKPKTRQRRC